MIRSAVEVTRDVARRHGASIATLVITYMILSLLLCTLLGGFSPLNQLTYWRPKQP